VSTVYIIFDQTSKHTSLCTKVLPLLFCDHMQLITIHNNVSPLWEPYSAIKIAVYILKAFATL